MNCCKKIIESKEYLNYVQIINEIEKKRQWQAFPDLCLSIEEYINIKNISIKEQKEKEQIISTQFDLQNIPDKVKFDLQNIADTVKQEKKSKFKELTAIFFGLLIIIIIVLLLSTLIIYSYRHQS